MRCWEGWGVVSRQASEKERASVCGVIDGWWETEKQCESRAFMDAAIPIMYACWLWSICIHKNQTMMRSWSSNVSKNGMIIACVISECEKGFGLRYPVARNIICNGQFGNNDTIYEIARNASATKKFCRNVKHNYNFFFTKKMSSGRCCCPISFLAFSF